MKMNCSLIPACYDKACCEQLSDDALFMPGPLCKVDVWILQDIVDVNEDKGMTGADFQGSISGRQHRLKLPLLRSIF